MGNDQRIVETVRVKKSARPWTGFFLGLFLGLAIAVILQQAGIWPLDKLLLFGSAGLFALIGILLGGAGRDRVGPFSSIVPLVLSVAMIAWGATGIAEINESGELNGGCTVEAASDIDSTVVTDTSRQDPFQVDPDGGLSWVATSPAPITNHLWEIYVDIGGIPVVVADNEEPEPNTDGDTENTGDVTDLSAYIEQVSDVAGIELDGVFIVGGNIEGEGGACDGFGFVELTADPFSTLIAQIAAGVGLLALIGLLVLAFNRTREAELVPEQQVMDDDIEPEPVYPEPPSDVEDSTAAAAGTGAAVAATRAGGAHIRPEEVEPDLEPEETTEPEPYLETPEDEPPRPPEAGQT
jgi:hypothetical protein